MTAIQRRTFLGLIAVTLLLATVSGVAQAKPLIGIGDQHLATLTEPHFQSLNISQIRVIVGWDVMRDPVSLDRHRQLISTALAQGRNVLVHFAASQRPAAHKPPPSLAAYRRGVTAFATAFPQITSYGVWNEANLGRVTPKLNARYARTLKAAIPSARKVVVLDVVDTPTMVRYTRRFRAAYGRHARKDVYGLHNYIDANHHRTTGTRAFLRATRGELWLTETGGIVSVPRKSRVRTRGEASQTRAVKHVFTLAKLNRRIKRVYFYDWQAHPRERWDSAFVRIDGTPRPALTVLRSHQ